MNAIQENGLQKSSCEKAWMFCRIKNDYANMSFLILQNIHFFFFCLCILVVSWFQGSYLTHHK